MELDGELDAAISWIGTNLDFDRNASVHVFEAIIRMVGGLLSGYHATGNAVLLAKSGRIPFPAGSLPSSLDAGGQTRPPPRNRGKMREND